MTPPNESPPGSPLALQLDLMQGGRLAPLVRALVSGEAPELLSPLTCLGADDFAADGVPPSLPPLPPRAKGGPDRRELAAGLAAANASYGHPRARELADRLADPATRVVVTGQQAGLFGGPLYTLSKAVAAARWAERLTEAGETAVPVFWIATEDHDYAEVARATVLAPDGPRTFDLGDDPDPLTPVGARSLGPEVEKILGELRGMPGGPTWDAWWKEVGSWYRPSARFGEAFARLLVRLLGERCPLLLDSQLPELKSAERPWLRRFVEGREELESAYREADDAIEARGFELQVAPQPGVSPLFLLHEGDRRRIEWQGEDGWGLRGLEGTGGNVDDLLARIDDNPITVSPGVRARPAVQDAVLGTSILILGPGELAYMPQVSPTYRVLGIQAPAVTLRPQVVVLEDKHVRWMEEAGIDLPLLLGESVELDRHLAARADVDLTSSLIEELAAKLDRLRGEALAIDKNLQRPWEKTREGVLRSLTTFGDRVARAAAHADGIQQRRVEQLRATALPGGKLQERVLSSAHFPARAGDAFAAALHHQMSLDPRRLQAVVLRRDGTGAAGPEEAGE